MVASSRASTAGWRKSQSKTRTPTLTLVVTAANAAMAAIGPGPSWKWSGKKMVEYPRSSSSRAESSQVRPGSGAWSSVAKRRRRGWAMTTFCCPPRHPVSASRRRAGEDGVHLRQHHAHALLDSHGEHLLHAGERVEVGADRHRRPAFALLDGDDHGRHRVPVVRAAVVVDVGIAQLEVAGRIGGDDLPGAVVAVALLAGHEEGDPSAGPEVVVDHGRRVAGGSPP